MAEPQSRVNGRHEGMCHHLACFNVSKKYQQLELIGFGGFGTVCKAINTETNTIVAIKKIDLKKCPSILTALRELQISNYLGNKSEAVIKLLDIEIPATHIRCFQHWDFDTIYLIYEYMPLDLLRAIRTIQLKQDDYQRLLAKMLFGLRDLHHANILHRDINPSNILLDNETPRNLKIGDFGSARAMKKNHSDDRMVWKPFDSLSDDESDDDKTKGLTDIKVIIEEMLSSYTEVTSGEGEEEEEEITSSMAKQREEEALTNGIGTIGYRAPELTLGCEIYKKPADIWAMGCVFAEMVTKSKLFKFEGQTDEEQFNSIISKMGSSFITDDLDFIDNKKGKKLARKKREESVPKSSKLSTGLEELGTKGVKLLREMLRFHPGERITAQNALRSPYFREIYQELLLEYGHPDLEEQIEDDKVKLHSETQMKKELWSEMLYFQGYKKRAVPKEEDKAQRIF